MKIQSVPKEELDRIKPLWEDLKQHHQDRTTKFKEYYKNQPFEKRRAELLSKPNLVIYLAQSENELLGFCVASHSIDVGQIDSLFVSHTHRHRGVGKALTEKALAWFDKKDIATIQLLVGEGNEEAISYYEKLGFSIRATMMQKLSN